MSNFWASLELVEQPVNKEIKYYAHYDADTGMVLGIDPDCVKPCIEVDAVAQREFHYGYHYVEQGKLVHKQPKKFRLLLIANKSGQWTTQNNFPWLYDQTGTQHWSIKND